MLAPWQLVRARMSRARFWYALLLANLLAIYAGAVATFWTMAAAGVLALSEEELLDRLGSAFAALGSAPFVPLRHWPFLIPYAVIAVPLASFGALALQVRGRTATLAGATVGVVVGLLISAAIFEAIENEAVAFFRFSAVGLCFAPGGALYGWIVWRLTQLREPGPATLNKP